MDPISLEDDWNLRRRKVSVRPFVRTQGDAWSEFFCDICHKIGRA